MDRSKHSNTDSEIKAYATANATRRKSLLAKGGGDEIKAYSSFHNLESTARNLNSRRSSTRASISRDPDLITSILEEKDAGNRFERVSQYVLSSKDEFDRVSAVDEEQGDADTVSEECKIFSVYFDSDFFHDSISSTLAKSKEDTGYWLIFFQALNATMSWLPSAINEYLPMPELFSLVEWNLRSIGQVFFCNNPVTGLVIVIALAVQSTHILAYGIIALVVGNIFALLLKFDRGLIASGLFGFNSFLCGLAIATFHSGSDFEHSMILSTIMVSMLSVILFVAVGKTLGPYKSPPFTIPFNLVTLAFLIASSTMTNVETIMVIDPALPSYANDNEQSLITAKAFVNGILRGIGQVFLADNVASGVLILLGIAICSRYLAMAAIIGSLIGNCVSVLCGSDNSMIESGLFGYNSSIIFCAMALFYVPSISSISISIIAAFATVLLQHTLIGLLSPFGLPIMTLPFCIMALTLIFLQGTTDVIISVPLSSITIPEDHLRRVLILKEGFSFLLLALDSNSDSKLQNFSRNSSEMLERLGSKMIRSSEEDIEKIVSEGDEVDQNAYSIFQKINTDGSVSKTQFVSYLKQNGLKDQSGIAFAEQAFNLMDLDGNQTLEADEFLSFSRVSFNLYSIRDKIKTFFDFVDADGNDDIDVDEINAALSYLEESALNDEQCQVLCEISGNKESVYAIDIINFVTIALLQEMIASTIKTI